MKLQIAALLLLVGAALFFYYWTSQDSERTTPDTPSATAIERSEPDLFGEDIRVSKLREDGSLQYHLDAQEIRQFDTEQLTRMTSPQLHMTSSTQPPWDIAAQQGYLRQRPNPTGVPEDVVYLRESVRMVQQHPQSGTVTLQSSAFYLYPDREYAETDQPVQIDTNVGRTEASGMNIDLISGIIHLKSNQQQRVHTIILPEQFKQRRSTDS